MPPSDRVRLFAGSPKKGKRRPGLQQRAQALAHEELRSHDRPDEFEVGKVLQEADLQAKTLLKLSQEIQASASLRHSLPLSARLQTESSVRRHAASSTSVLLEA